MCFFCSCNCYCFTTRGAVDCSGGRSTRSRMAVGRKTMATAHTAVTRRCTVTRRLGPASNEPKLLTTRVLTWTMPRKTEEETWRSTGPVRSSWCFVLTQRSWRKKTPHRHGGRSLVSALQCVRLWLVLLFNLNLNVLPGTSRLRGTRQWITSPNIWQSDWLSRKCARTQRQAQLM